MASGGMMQFTREPSGRRASTNGWLSSTRRPMGATIRSMTLRTCWSSAKARSVLLRIPARSTKILSAPLTMISVTSGFASRSSTGPRPTASLKISRLRTSSGIAVGMSVHSASRVEMVVLARWRTSAASASVMITFRRFKRLIRQSWTSFLMRWAASRCSAGMPETFQMGTSSCLVGSAGGNEFASAGTPVSTGGGAELLIRMRRTTSPTRIFSPGVMVCGLVSSCLPSRKVPFRLPASRS